MPPNGVTDIYAQRLQERVLAYNSSKQKEKPIAQAHLGEAQVRLCTASDCWPTTVAEIDATVSTGDRVSREMRARGRLSAAHIVRESDGRRALLLNASGASAHF